MCVVKKKSKLDNKTIVLDRLCQTSILSSTGFCLHQSSCYINKIKPVCRCDPYCHIQHRGTDLRRKEHCDWQAAFGRDMRLSGAVWRVIWDEWMGLFIMSSDRMTNWLTPLWEVLSYSSSLLSQTLSSSCAPSKIVQPQILYDDVISSVFNRKGKKRNLLIKDFSSENIFSEYQH